MGATTKAVRSAGRVAELADEVRSNDYVRRLIEDEELRENLQDAFDSARVAYERLADGKATTLLDDSKVHDNLQEAISSLHTATQQLRGRQRRRRWTKLLALAVMGAVVGLVLSESARKAVLDKLFGAEEEFDYSSTTTPPPPSQSSTSSDGDAAADATATSASSSSSESS